MATVSKTKVLRSVFLDPEIDESLRQAAFRLKVSKGELIRTYVERGLHSERQASRAEPARRGEATAARTGRTERPRGAARKDAVPA